MDSFRVGRSSTCKRGADFQPAKILNFQLAVERVVDRFVQSEEINQRKTSATHFQFRPNHYFRHMRILGARMLPVIWGAVKNGQEFLFRLVRMVVLQRFPRLKDELQMRLFDR